METRAIFEFGEFRLRPSSRLLERCDQAVALNRRAFDVLLYLVQHPGRVISKDELLRCVWEDAFVDENNLPQSISALRRALGEHPGAPSFIATIPGRGYQFLASVTIVEDPGPAGAPPQTAVPGDPLSEGMLVQQRTFTTSIVTERLQRPVLRWVIATGMVLALCALGVWGLWERTHSAVPGDHHEIVLADLQNTTGEPEFSAPLKTALSIDLRESPFLAVTGDSKISDTLKLMEQPAQTPLTPSLARDVCRRVNGQAVLDATIAKLGSKYLVTLTASDCASGDTLVQSRATAKNRDGVLDAVDSVAANMRKRLGEPLRSLRLYSQPVVLAKETGSFDALRAYTQAHDLGISGKFQDSVPLFQRAIELDPKFAAAYADLAAVYTNLGESALATTNFTKAYELRDYTDEKDRLYIVAAYDQRVTGDLDAAIGNLEAWTSLYPDAPEPWANEASAYTDAGQYERALTAAQHAETLAPDAPFGYIPAARAQMALGHVDAAKSTCRVAISHQLDIADIRGLLFRAGALQHDDATMAEQVAWAKGTASQPYLQLQQSLYNMARGRAREGADLIDDLANGYRKQGQQERAQRMLGTLPRQLVYMGEVDAARLTLKALPPLEGSTDIPVALAQVGDTSAATALMQRESAAHPADTLWQEFRLPQIRAAIALTDHRPDLAIEALRRAAAYENRNSEVPSMRGQAYLALRQPAAAITEFRKVIDHPGIEPLTPNLALAHLGIARALALQGSRDASRQEYERFFAFWKQADKDLPVLRAAQAEYAQLH